MAVVEEIYQSVIDGDMNGATEGVNKAIEEGMVHPEAVLKISGVPHAQIVKI